MTKIHLEKENFYSEVIKLIELSRKSVHFYSISCCFGFYSQGLSTFDSVLVAIRHALGRRVGNQWIDVRILVKVDYDNPIDVYAAERFVQLEKRFGCPPGMPIERAVFRELQQEAETLQFLVVDDKYLITTSFQDEIFDENLGLVLNQIQNGVRFDKDDDPVEFQKYVTEFSDTWKRSRQLDIETKPVSRRMMKFFLQKWRGMPEAKTERELHLLLTGYLQGIFDPSIVDLETTVGPTRIDLLVGSRPQYKRYGIEVKLKPDDGYVDAIVGQLRKYREEYEGGLELLVIQPRYTAQKRRYLIDQLNEIEVGLIELH
jgi:hypothetical protein